MAENGTIDFCAAELHGWKKVNSRNTKACTFQNVPAWLLHFSQSSHLYSQVLPTMFQLLHTLFVFRNCTCYLASLLNWYDTDTGDIHRCTQRPNESFKSLMAQSLKK